MNEVKGAILAGIVFGICLGIYFTFRLETHLAIISGTLSGIAFGAILYFFVTSKAVKRQTQIVTVDNNPIIRSTSANRFKNGEAVGGKLYLLKDKVQFQSHSFNLQNHGLIIELTQIKEVVFYNTLGLIPNGLAIVTHKGEKEKFVIYGRRKWKEDLEKLMAIKK
jgi:hypothetical protein